MTIPIQVTDRLRLRAFTADDAPVMHNIMTGQDVMKYFPGAPTVSLKHVEKMIVRILQHWSDRQYGLWAIEFIETSELIGRCGLQQIPETDEVEVDFIVSRDYWGQGIATEAGQASVDFAFDKLKVKELVGIVHPNNIASQRVLEKLGLQFVEATQYFGMDCYRYLAKNTRE